MNKWKQHAIYVREDGSYVVQVSQGPYHVPNEGGWVDGTEEIQWQDVHDFATNNVDNVQIEPAEIDIIDLEEHKEYLKKEAQRQFWCAYEHLYHVYTSAKMNGNDKSIFEIVTDFKRLKSQLQQIIESIDNGEIEISFGTFINVVKYKWCLCGTKMNKRDENNILKCPSCGSIINLNERN